MTAALTPEQAYLATVAELNTLAERSKHVTHVDVLRIASMSADELRRRAIVALDWHSCFSHCLDGMPELKAIPGGAPDGCWLPGPVRGVVEALLRRSDLTYEDTSHGRRKSPSPEAQRIEALEAELAACKRDAAKHRFLNVTCSQCGRNFGPGNFGFSRCEDHTGESYNLGIDDAAKWLDKRADDYDSEHGITDPDTGTREYPGDGLDYINELRENADSIRELKRAAIDAAMAAGEKAS